MKLLNTLLALGLLLSNAFAMAADDFSIEPEAGPGQYYSIVTRNGYREINCPPGQQMRSCQIDTEGYSCDGVRRNPQWNQCGADSHHNRDCRITAYCERPQPQYHTYWNSVQGHAGSISCQRPGEYKVGRCQFRGSCDNIRELHDGCYADSHNNRRCEMGVTCASNW